ncbi:hypothetical protein [Methanoplanus endosymbiosus]|uniref:Uncharacterized protein n=1 Tax=Methanoplanus endosymbiosus TaxID=33865 RepID=A0A9E7PNX0_9EURY|nr:hypothetical protein [Methanoplanus endosymbiosus]UUX93739.1 hypothetical protein L6E24_06390 [Methanoplanus endosymbiosus]
MGYLLIVDYNSDAERKRIDATIDRWKKRKKIHKEKGVIIRLGDENIEDFLKDLYARMDDGRKNVRIFSAERCNTDIDEISERYQYETNIETEVVRRFIRYILSKFNSGYEGINNGVESFTAYTRKGQAKVDIIYFTHPENTKISLSVSGYGSVVSLVAKRIDEELKSYLNNYDENTQ